MSEDYSEETIAHMRNLLLKGARMLDEHCPKCNTPLFLIKETNLKYCPNCRVYLATEEELKRAKIDLDKVEVYDFEEYWSGKNVNKKETRGKEQLGQKPNTNEVYKGENLILSTIDEAIIALIERLMIIVQRRDLEIDEILKIIDKLLEVRRKIE